MKMMTSSSILLLAIGLLLTLFTEAAVTSSGGSLTSLKVEKAYKTTLRRSKLHSGTHTMRLLPDGLSSDDMDELVKMKHNNTAVRHPLLHTINQSLYFPVIQIAVDELSGGDGGGAGKGTAEKRFLTRLVVGFEFSRVVANFVPPKFHLMCINKANNKFFEITHRPIYKPTLNETLIEIPLSQREFPLEGNTKFPEQLEVILTPQERTVSSYFYEMPSGVPDRLLNGDMFDMFPSNATMMTKMMARYDSEKDTLGMWATRRSPIPDFSMVCGEDNLALTVHSSARAPPGGIGLANGFPDVKRKLQEDLDSPSGKKRPYHMAVHFYEEYPDEVFDRELSEETIDEMIAKLTNGKAEGEGLKFVENEGFKLKVNSVNGIFKKDHEDDVKPPTLKVKYLEDTRHIGITFDDFLKPLDQVLLTVEMEDGQMIFREVERNIPFVPGQPFGWYFVLGTYFDDGTVTLKGIKRFRKLRLEIITRKETHPAALMGRWLTEQGGDVRGVRLSDTAQAAYVPDRHDGAVTLKKKNSKTGAQEEGEEEEGKIYLRQRGLAATRDFQKGDVVAVVPYRAVISERIAEHNQWAQLLKKEASAEYAAFALKHNFRPDAMRFMIMTFMAITQPSHPVEGLNWKHYFDTFQQEHPPTPPFYSEEELDLFDFSPAVQLDAVKHNVMWQMEWQLLKKYVPWVSRHKSYEAYKNIRSQVEARVVNATGMLLMIPLMDWMNHDDAPTMRVHFDDKGQSMVFSSVADVKKGGHLTCDFGAQHTSKKDFLIQFGFISAGGLDSVDVQIDAYLDDDTDDESKKGTSSSEMDDDDDDDEEEVAARAAARQQASLREHMKRNKKTLTLTKDKSTLEQLRDAVWEDSDRSLKEGSLKAALMKILTKRLATIPREDQIHRLTGSAKMNAARHILLQTKNIELEHMAQRLAKSEREVLEYHIEILNNS